MEKHKGGGEKGQYVNRFEETGWGKKCGRTKVSNSESKMVVDSNNKVRISLPVLSFLGRPLSPRHSDVLPASSTEIEKRTKYNQLCRRVKVHVDHVDTYLSHWNQG